MKLLRLKLLLALTLTLLSAAGCASTTPKISDVYQSVNESVVVINTITAQRLARNTEDTVVSTSKGLGTGVVINKDGTILTAAHVIDAADQVLVTLADGSVLEASVMSSSKLHDLAIVKIDVPPNNLVPATLGDSDNVLIGEQLMVIGTPYGSDHTLTVGHLSARRIVELDILQQEVEYLQTDAAINQGNSGGPVFNLNGEVIGIVSYIKSQSGGYEGLGFAVSINVAKQELMARPRLWTGLTTVPLEGALARALNIPNSDGLLVQAVATGSIGSKLGLRGGTIPVSLGGETVLLGGDVITRFNDKRFYFTESGIADAYEMLRALQPGDTFAVTIIREGKEVELSVVLD